MAHTSTNGSSINKYVSYCIYIECDIYNEAWSKWTLKCIFLGIPLFLLIFQWSFFLWAQIVILGSGIAWCQTGQAITWANDYVKPRPLDRVLASPKFLPTDSDLFSSRIRCTDRLCRKKADIYILIIYINNIYIMHVYVKNVNEMI